MNEGVLRTRTDGARRWGGPIFLAMLFFFSPSSMLCVIAMVSFPCW